MFVCGPMKVRYCVVLDSSLGNEKGRPVIDARLRMYRSPAIHVGTLLGKKLADG